MGARKSGVAQELICLENHIINLFLKDIDAKVR